MQIKARRRGEKWTVLIDLPRKNGRRRQKRFTAETKTEAERLARRYCEQDNVEQMKPSTNTVGDLLDAWLASVRLSIQSRTYASYDLIVRLYLKPQLGSVRLTELTPEVIEAARDKWMNGKRQDKRQGTISSTTMRRVLGALRTGLKFGIERKWLRENPAATVRPPKPTEVEKRPLEADEVRTLLKCARTSPLYPAILIAVYSGVRRGELLALNWSDFNFDDRSVTVRRALEVDRLDGYTVKVKAPKNRSSRRTIPLPASVVDDLRRYKVEQAQRLLADGVRQSGDTLVIDRGDGHPWQPDTFSQVWIDFARTSGVRRVRFHDLRATFASLMIEAGVDPVTVQHFLGHSTLNMTMTVYARATTRAKLAAADRLEAALATGAV